MDVGTETYWIGADPVSYYWIHSEGLNNEVGMGKGKKENNSTNSVESRSSYRRRSAYILKSTDMFL